jgi:hypothetical protein
VCSAPLIPLGLFCLVLLVFPYAELYGELRTRDTVRCLDPRGQDFATGYSWSDVGAFPPWLTCESWFAEGTTATMTTHMDSMFLGWIGIFACLFYIGTGAAQIIRARMTTARNR